MGWWRVGCGEDFLLFYIVGLLMSLCMEWADSTRYTKVFFPHFFCMSKFSLFLFLHFLLSILREVTSLFNRLASIWDAPLNSSFYTFLQFILVSSIYGISPYLEPSFTRLGGMARWDNTPPHLFHFVSSYLDFLFPFLLFNSLTCGALWLRCCDVRVTKSIS